MSFLRRIKPDSFKEKAFGCIIGSFCGDACGAYYDYMPQVLTSQELEESTDMNGGGVWQLGPG